MDNPDLQLGYLRWKSVIHGLMIREVRCRFSGGNIGYAWSFLMPVVWIGGIVAFFQYLDRQPMQGISNAWFVSAGMLPYVIFRQTISGVMRANSASRGIIGMGRLRFADVIFAAILLELLNGFILVAVIFTGLRLFAAENDIASISSIVTGLMLTWALGASFGRAATLLGAQSDLVVRLLPIALRPMFWVSGIFFTVAELPEELRALLWFNPLLHTTEYIRYGVFGAQDNGFVDLTVPILAIAAFYLLSVGLEYVLTQKSDRVQFT